MRIWVGFLTVPTFVKVGAVYCFNLINFNKMIKLT